MVFGKRALFNQLIINYLQNESSVLVTETVANLEAMYEAINCKQISLLVMTEFEGTWCELNVVSILKKNQENPAKIAVINSSMNVSSIHVAHSHGIDAFITYESTPRELLETLIQVMKGKMIYPSSLMNQAHTPVLTPKEKEILLQIAEGKTNKEISNEFFVSKRTIEHHISSILSKMNSKTRVQAVVTALQQGILY